MGLGHKNRNKKTLTEMAGIAGQRSPIPQEIFGEILSFSER